MEKKIKQVFYRNMMLTLLGATRAIGRADFRPPSKWVSMFESVRASSDILYFKLSSIDEDVEEEFMEKEEILEKRLGKEKFYSKEELDDLKNKRDQITV